jgi:hypothetical protein
MGLADYNPHGLSLLMTFRLLNILIQSIGTNAFLLWRYSSVASGFEGRYMQAENIKFGSTSLAYDPS